jgi:phosphoribosylformimino-5-aminoimidazole carboxamide ribotide isomerase
MASVAGVAIEWGGGLNDDADLKSAFNAGVSYAVIGSVAARRPELFEQWLSQYGSERMVLGADVRNGRVAVAGWLETEDATVDQLVDRFTEAGLSQAIVTEISRDGMLSGPEFALYERLQTKYTDVDFTISGGVSSIDDVVRAGDLGLRRIIIGKAIYEGRITLKQLEHLL